MISPFAVQQFLTRPLRNSNVAKEISADIVNAKFAEKAPPLTIPFRHHQKVSYLLGLKHKRYLVFCEPGLGKSAISIALYRKALFENPASRMLVAVPNTSNLGQWADETEKHAPGLGIQKVNGNGPAERWAQLTAGKPITVITYMGLLALLCNATETRKESRRWQIQPELLAKVSGLFNFLCLDECNAVANHRSLTYKVCKAISWARTTEYSIGLTGTPFGNDPHVLWAQFHVVDQGETLGPTLGLFRAAFFETKVNYWGGFEYKFKQSRQADLSRLLRHNSIRYTQAECLDLPKLNRVVRIVEPAAEISKYYAVLTAEMKAANGNYHAVENVYVKMRYLTAGFLAARTEAGEKIKVAFRQNPKLEALLADINDIDESRKIVIFHWYELSGDVICEELQKRKIPFLRLSGKSPKSLKETIAEKFTNGNARILVSSSAGARGGNWQVANYVFLYETPSAPDIRKQEIMRCHRMGQALPVTVFDYAVRNSIDVKILQAIKRGQNLFDLMIDGKSCLQ